MPTDTTEILNQMLQNFQIQFKDAGDKLCGPSWACCDSHFIYDSIGFIRQGEIYLKVSGQERRVPCGGLYYIPAMAIYSHHAIGETADVYWTHFIVSMGGRHISEQLTFPAFTTVPSPGETMAIFEQIFECQTGSRLGDPLRVTGLMYELAAHFFHLCKDEIRLCNTEKFAQMRQVVDYISKNLDKSLSIDALAAQAGLNQNYFIEVFRNYFHETPIQFVLNRKEEAAREMLVHSDRSVKEIGLSLGFSNQNYFSEFFKKRSGYSPSEYRTLKKQ